MQSGGGGGRQALYQIRGYAHKSSGRGRQEERQGERRRETERERKRETWGEKEEILGRDAKGSKGQGAWYGVVRDILYSSCTIVTRFSSQSGLRFSYGLLFHVTKLFCQPFANSALSTRWAKAKNCGGHVVLLKRMQQIYFMKLACWYTVCLFHA